MKLKTYVVIKNSNKLEQIRTPVNAIIIHKKCRNDLKLCKRNISKNANVFCEVISVIRDKWITPCNVFVFLARRTSRWHPTVAALTRVLCYNHYTFVYYYYYYYYCYARVCFHHLPGPRGGVLRPMMNAFSSSAEAVAVVEVASAVYTTRILYILQTKLLLERVSTRYTDGRGCKWEGGGGRRKRKQRRGRHSGGTFDGGAESRYLI